MSSYLVRVLPIRRYFHVHTFLSADIEYYIDGPTAHLLDLINDSLGIAGWLILLSVIIVIADIAFVVINIKSTSNLIFGVTVSSPTLYFMTTEFQT